MSDGFWMAVVAVLSGLLMLIGHPKVRAWFRSEVDRLRGVSVPKVSPPRPKRPQELAAEEHARHLEENPELLFPWYVPEWGGKCYEDDVFNVYAISRDGDTLKLPEAKEVSLPRDGLIILDRTACHDFKGRLVFDARRTPQPFRFATSFHEGMALISDSEKNRFGFVDKATFGMIVPPEYHEGHDFHDGVALVRREEQWGFVDRTGLFQPLPRDANRISTLPTAGSLANRSDSQFPPCPSRDFREGLAAVCSVRNTWGYIDKTGKWVIPPRFDWAGSFSEGLAAVRVGATCQYIDCQGNVAIAGPFVCARRFSHGLAPVQITGPLWGLINQAGELIVEPAWLSVESCADGVVPFTVLVHPRHLPHGGLYHVESGESQVLEYFHISPFSEGIGIVERVKFGFIDTKGCMVAGSELRWSKASPFHQGMALVESRHL